MDMKIRRTLSFTMKDLLDMVKKKSEELGVDISDCDSLTAAEVSRERLVVFLEGMGIKDARG